jgi:hypothetical protein
MVQQYAAYALTIDNFVRFVDEVEDVQVRKLQGHLGEGVYEGAGLVMCEDKPLAARTVKFGTIGDLEGFTVGQAEECSTREYEPWQRRGQAMLPGGGAPMAAYSCETDAVRVGMEALEDQASKLRWYV